MQEGFISLLSIHVFFSGFVLFSPHDNLPTSGSPWVFSKCLFSHFHLFLLGHSAILLDEEPQLMPSLSSLHLLFLFPFIPVQILICLCVLSLSVCQRTRQNIYVALSVCLWVNQDFTGASRRVRCDGAFLNRDLQGGLKCVQLQDRLTWLLSFSPKAHQQWTTLVINTTHNSIWGWKRQLILSLSVRTYIEINIH